MFEPVKYALFLYGKYSRADRETRRRLKPFMREALDNGVAPLGFRPGVARSEYWWLIFDESRMARADLDRYLKKRTPPGCEIRTLKI